MNPHLAAIGMHGDYRQVRIPCDLCDGEEFTLLQSQGRIAEPGVYGELAVSACNRCGFIMINPRYEERFYRDYYRKTYRQVATGDRVPTREYLDRQAARGEKILEFLKPLCAGPGKLLDVGCSSGGTMVPFIKASWNAVGVDPDVGCVEYGQDRLKLPVRIGDAENLDFPAGTFDLVLNLGTLEHVYDFRRAFKELRRILKSDGVLFFQYRSSQMWGSPLEYFNHNHYCYFSDNTIRLAMLAFGFEPLRMTSEAIEGIPGMRYVVARPAAPAGKRRLLEAVGRGLRDDAGELLSGLQRYSESFRERARNFLALAERKGHDPQRIYRAIRSGQADCIVLDGPPDEAVRRGILEAQRFLQFEQQALGSGAP